LFCGLTKILQNMAAEIITKEDLQLFKSELIHELRELIALPSNKAQGKKPRAFQELHSQSKASSS